MQHKAKTKRIRKRFSKKNILLGLPNIFKIREEEATDESSKIKEQILTAVNKQDWLFIIDAAPEILRTGETYNNKSDVAAAYSLALRKVHDYSSCVNSSQTYHSLIVNATPNIARKAISAHCQSLHRLGRLQEAVNYINSIPRKFLRSPIVSAALQDALISIDTEKSIIVAHNTIAHAKKKFYRYLGRLSYAYLSIGRHPEEVCREVQYWKLIKLGSGKDYHLSGYLCAAIDSRLGNSTRALEALNKELKLTGLSPLGYKNPSLGLVPENLESNAPCSEENGALISVLMPAFNAEKYLSNAIASVLGQTHQNIELIIIDDASTDKTFHIAKKWQDNDHRIRLASLSENRGPYIARNIGLSIAKGQYITTHDADDWLHPSAFSVQLKWILESKAKACIGGWIRTNERGEVLIFAGGQVIHICPPSLMIAREVIETLGFFDHVRVSGDSEYMQRIISFYGQEEFIDKRNVCLAIGRLHQDSLTRSEDYGYDIFGINTLRCEYWKLSREWHRACKRQGKAPYLKFDPSQRKFPAPKEIVCARPAIPEYRIYDNQAWKS